MQLSKAPAFQFYPRDFLAGVTGFTNEEAGILIKLLCLQWERGPLPADPKVLSRLVGRSKAIPEAVLSKFALRPDDTRANERLEAVRAEQQKYHEQQKLNAQKRWNKKAKSPDSCQPDATALPPDPDGISQTHPLHTASAYCNGTHTLTAHADAAELPTEAQAVSLGTNAGIPEAFSRLVYSEWHEKQGCYRDGPVPFIRRLMGRWTRERAQWEAGTHSSQRKYYGSHSQTSRPGSANDYNANRAAAADY